MDTTAALARLETALLEPLALAGGDPAVEAAARTLRTNLSPAVHRLALDLAEQAAAEVSAQLAEYDVDVVLHAGEPSLVLRPHERAQRPPERDLDDGARLTLRLPGSLKADIDDAARTAGMSVNAWLVDALARAVQRSGRRRPGRRVQGSIQT
jgi:hypothetical protein